MAGTPPSSIGGSSVAATIIDGGDVTEGAIADAAVTGDNAGTVNAHLRGLTKDLGDPAALADATANPTRAGLAAFGLLWNGATWDRVPGSVRGQWIEGAIASGAADSGNPVKVGGKYNAALPTLTDGQRGDVQLTPKGSQFTSYLNPANSAWYQGVGTVTAVAGADGTSNASMGSLLQIATGSVTGLQVAPVLFGGATWDRERNNEQATLLASAARTATTTSADQTNYNGRGVAIVVNVTAEGGATTLTLTVQGKDSISSNYYDLITGVVVYNAATDTPPTTRAVILYPGNLSADYVGVAGATGAAGKAVSVPRVWRITVTPSDATSQTYSVSGVTLV